MMTVAQLVKNSSPFMELEGPIPHHWTLTWARWV